MRCTYSKRRDVERRRTNTTHYLNWVLISLSNICNTWLLSPVASGEGPFLEHPVKIIHAPQITTVTTSVELCGLRKIMFLTLSSQFFHLSSELFILICPFAPVQPSPRIRTTTSWWAEHFFAFLLVEIIAMCWLMCRILVNSDLSSI